MLAETRSEAWEIRSHSTTPRAVLEDSWAAPEAYPDPEDHWEEHSVLKFRPRADEPESISYQYLKNLHAARLIAQWAEEADEVEESAWLEFEAMLDDSRHG